MKLKNIKATYVFNILAFFILIASISIYKQFDKTKEKVRNINIESNIKNVNEISDNILGFIREDMSSKTILELLKNKKERNKLEHYLEILITDRYKYIYLIDKEKPDSLRFRFLLDGAKNINEKSEFLEPFIPLNNEKFILALKTKKTVFFNHEDETKLWMTYIKPFIVNGKVQALLVFDFSLKEYTDIVKVSTNMEKNFKYAFLFLLLILMVIVWFSFIDLKREKIKEEINKKLKQKSSQLIELNDSLEERIQREIEKNRLKNQQLMEQSRLAQMGEMISMIAHQWRQPLSAISSMSASIKLKLILGKVDEEFLKIASEKISHSSEYLSQTIDDFRNFYKSQKEMQETSFKEIVDDVLKIVSVSLDNKKIEVKVDIESEDVFVTYANELKQVLMNLIKNAEDIFEESKIKDAKIIIKTYSDEKFYFLSVTDNAGGIDKSVIKKIFDPYFSTKKQKDGTGLGLYMSKTIVEEHCQGSLDVLNIDGGACFIIKVPNIKFI